MLHPGLNRYGKSDQVPGFFWVVTEFFSISLIPVIPINSFLIYERTGSGVPVGLIWKSVLLAWFRAGCYTGTVALGIVSMVGLADLNGNFEGAWLATFAVPLPLALIWLSYPFSRAGPLRAIRLAAKVGIAPEDLAPYFLTWKHLPRSSDPQNMHL